VQSNFDSGANLSYEYRQIAARIDDYVRQYIGVPNLILVSIYKLNWIMSYSQLDHVVNVVHTAVSQQFAKELTEQPAQITAHLQKVYGAHPLSCVSQGAKEDLQSLIGDITPMTTIYNPCDATAIQKAAQEDIELAQWGLATKQYLIQVASFAPMKAHRDLLTAYAQTDQILPLVLVGKGKLENEMKQLAIQLGLKDQVQFLGYQSNPYPLIKHASLMVMTSRFEGFGYVIVEAQALGIPVISTDCPFGPRELLPKHCLVAAGDIKGLKQLLQSAMQAPNDYHSSFNQQLLPDRIAQQYLDFAQSIFLQP
ncbi:MAG: glycosyltransferase, partial [Psychrobacter sp.]|nr:glycosyltransferase [Psychrobacter sp.]